MPPTSLALMQQSGKTPRRPNVLRGISPILIGITTTVMVGFGMGLSACTSSETTAVGTVPEAPGSEVLPQSTPASEPSVSDTPVSVNGAPLVIPENAVPIDYFVAKTNPPLLKETLVPMKSASKSVAMIVNNITYAGVVCGFSFTGADRPVSPIKFHFQIERDDNTVVDTTIDVAWDGDQDQPASGNADGWNFLADAQVNRNGPGWVVQVGAVPEGGGKGKPIPKRALCTLSSGTEMPVTVGPVAYWAGFATV
jgi:hypothetical protein